MGQKINPLGFRLGTTQRHHSLWFAEPKNYSKGLQEDQKIRDCIKNYVRDWTKNYVRDCIKKNVKTYSKIPSDEEIISRIEIQKSIDLIKVVIYTSFPDLPKLLRKDKQQRIKELQTNVAKRFHAVNQKLNIAITIIAKPYGQPTILAEYIAEQLNERLPFRKVMQKAIELAIGKANTKGIKGIKIQIAGRIEGKEIARVEWFREGRVPLQTIRAKIDYCSYTVRMVYGVLGIKIWIFAGEE